MRDGSITLTFRVWKKPQARAAGRYRFGPDDVLVAGAVTQVRAGTISDADARRSGFESADELRAGLGVTKATNVYRVEFQYERSADERTRTALDAKLSAAGYNPDTDRTLLGPNAWNTGRRTSCSASMTFSTCCTSTTTIARSGQQSAGAHNCAPLRPDVSATFLGQAEPPTLRFPFASS